MKPFPACALVLAAFACVPLPLYAQAADQTLSAPDMFALADRLLDGGRTADAEAVYDALTQDRDPELRAEARFRKGMLLADQRRYQDAALAFRALLDEKPNAARVRLELARVLALIGDERAARRELRQAQAAGLPDDVAVAVDQFAMALRTRKHIGGSIEIALAPDSNINRATDARTLDTVIAPLTLSEDARAQSGLGIKLSGQAYARVELGDGFSLLPRLSGRGNLYRKQVFNDISGSGLIGIEWRSKQDQLSLSLGQTWRWYGSDLYARTETLGGDWLHALGSRAQLTTNASVSRAHYLGNPLQKGMLFDLATTYERALSAKAGASISLSLTRQTAMDPGYASWSGGGSLLAWSELGKSTMFVTTGVRRLEGDERLFLYPDRRREWLIHSTLGVTFRQLTVSGFAPTARVILERNTSSVGIYDYRRIAFEGGITRAF